MIKIEPHFDRLLQTLKHEKTDRPVLFEFIINENLIKHYAGNDMKHVEGLAPELLTQMYGFRNLGYDYTIVSSWHTPSLIFPKPEKRKGHTLSQNEGAIITDLASFEAYPWPNVKNIDYSNFEKLTPLIPEGMKLIPCSNGGVLENATDLMGFENLCINSLVDPDLTTLFFDNIGQRLLDHYENLLQFDSVGAVMVNDDWGFKTQTMLDTESMRKYVIKWHKKIVDKVHEHGKVAILHSCGNLDSVMDDIIDYIGFDGKHSFEDGIIPVEEAYRKWGHRIAIMGGIDVDFLSRSTPAQVCNRAAKLIEQTFESGGFALGSGNSIPDFVPPENYLAMLRAAWDLW